MHDGRARIEFSLKRVAGWMGELPGIRTVVPIYKQLIRLVERSRIASINRDKVLCEIGLFHRRGLSGLTDERRNPRLIVSLTSFPDRIYDIHFALFSLLTQTCKPDMVVLWLAHDQFPGGEDDVPESVLAMKRHGLTIAWCEDVKSYKKLVPALRSFPEDIIVTADDDIFYPPFWLERLYASYIDHPDSISVHRALRIKCRRGGPRSYRHWQFCGPGTVGDAAGLFPTTGGGVLFPPTLKLHKDISCADIFMDLAPYADDIWVWAMAGLARHRIRVVDGCVTGVTSVNLDREVSEELDSTLWKRNRTANDAKIGRILEHYPELAVLCRVTASSALKSNKHP